MRFKITSKKENNEIVTHYFDNISLEIINENGIPVVLREDPRCQNLIREIYDKEVIGSKKKEDITNLRITLGFNCNFHCKYCLEHEAYGERDKVIPIYKDLDTRAEIITKKIINNFPNLKQVTFWGGEPLVYIKLLKKITKLLKENNPNLQFSTITNGSLLNLDIANWLVENNFGVTISHDGPSFNVYRDDKDPLDNPTVVKAIQYLEKEGKKNKIRPTFNIVVTPENSNLQEIEPFFEAKLGFIPAFGFESIVKLDTHTDDIVSPFTKKEIQLLLNNLVAYGSTENNLHSYSSIRNFVSSVLKDLINKRGLPSIQCMIKDKDFAAVDINGKVLVCHGSIHSYCDIDDIDKVNFPKVNGWKDKKGCNECPFLVACLGGCPMIDTEEDQSAQCRNLKIWASGIFIAAWKVLFDTTICRIEPCEENENANSN